MLSITLLKRNMYQMLKPFFIFIAVLSMYTVVIIYMYDPELIDMLNDYQEALPQMMSAAGMSGIAASLIEFIKIYLYGFLMLLFPMIFTIIICSSFITRYIDSGSMACLLASPNTRRKIIITQAVSVVIGITLLMGLITAIGAGCCGAMFPGELNINRYLMLNGCTWLLQLAIGGIVFFASCIFNEAKNYYAAGAGIPLIFFLLNMLGNMGGKMENLKYATIYSLLPADKIVAGESGIWQYNLVLAVIAAVLFMGGIMAFSKRDLPL